MVAEVPGVKRRRQPRLPLTPGRASRDKPPAPNARKVSGDYVKYLEAVNAYIQ